MNSIENKIKKILNKETINYIIFGVGTTIVNIIVYQGLLTFNVDYKISNIIALVLAKLFSYITNKIIVFKSRQDSIWNLFKEFIKFSFTRGFTGLIDYFGLIFMVEALGFSKVISKYFLQVIVIILNYIFGKLVVFRKDDKNIN